MKDVRGNLCCDSLGHIKEDVSTIRSAASADFGQVPGTFARPPHPFGQNWSDALSPRKIEVKGWVSDRSQKETTGLANDQAMENLGE